MALNLSPETGVKLTKKDRAHVLKKMKQGWKATCLIPDYVFDDEGNLDFLIEYQGIQHYQPKEKFGGWSGLQKQQFNDLKKREYCKKHNITLVIIPYTDENIIDYDYIMTKAGY